MKVATLDIDVLEDNDRPNEDAVVCPGSSETGTLPYAKPILVDYISRLPKRSPFRYPGGKTALIPGFRLWLKSLSRRPKVVVEPFAGGGTMSLTTVMEDLADGAWMNELDPTISAFWKATLNPEEAEWLAKRILNFEVNTESVEAELRRTTTTQREIAFQTLLRNRTNRGGLMTPNSRSLRKGENGRGVRSRWYAETLSARIRDIAAVREKITFTTGDGVAIISKHLEEIGMAWFIDPPYSVGGKKAGDRLYNHSGVDHEALFLYVSRLVGPWLMTYDDAPEVRKLAQCFGFEIEPVVLRNSHNRNSGELLIAWNLSWARGQDACSKLPRPIG
ncbi:MAG: DNA adenine methylase [Capsulimonadales bacterium]|nr:DNA adenine methylase [Capsulimonadales bacterium]